MNRVNLDRGAELHQRVEQPRADALDGRFAPAIAAHRVHHVRALAPRLKHLRQQLDRVLQIGIEREHDVAARAVQAGAQRRLLAEIARQLQAHHAGPCEPRQQRHQGFVVAAIVDDDDLPAWRHLPKLVSELFQQDRQVACFVVSGYHAR
jgi:hypothetical protein